MYEKCKGLNMKKMWFNFVDSFYLGYRNLYPANKFLFFLLLLPGAFNAIVEIIEHVKWMINKI